MSQIEQAEGEPMERPTGLMAISHDHIPPAVPSDADVPEVSYEFDKMELTRRVLMLAAHQDKIANYLQGFIDAPTRRDFDVLLADNVTLRRQVGVLFDAVTSLTTVMEAQAQSIRNLKHSIEALQRKHAA